MTAKIKLNAASGGGSVSLKAPSSTTGNAAVDLQLPVADGTSGQVLKTDGSGNLSFGADTGGKILQVVTATQESTTSWSSSSFVDISGMTATINGVSSGSKIMVDIQLLVGKSADSGLGFKLFRDSTFLPSYSGSTDTFAEYIQQAGDSYTYGFMIINYKFIDTHGQSAGSNLTYKLQGTSYSGSNTYYLNRRNYDSAQRGSSRITLTEIAA
tara:strand:- start:45 stop:680 length:636 start_codon:yes stop_codon:yes gene_type:complete